jgi:hypothetical protein
MSVKIKLLGLAIKKVADDSDFMAYFLLKYSQIEKLSEQEVISFLKCSQEDYYKLGLCKTPDANSTNFIEQLNKVSEYTHTSSIELNNILKRVITIEKFAHSDNTSFLMAARDKKKGKKDKENE